MRRDNEVDRNRATGGVLDGIFRSFGAVDMELKVVGDTMVRILGFGRADDELV